MADLSYRNATPDDLAFIVRLIVGDSVGTSADDPRDVQAPAYTDALAAIDADPNQMLLIAELSGEPVGTFQLTFIPGIVARGMWRGLIESVHVAPEFRNQGIGGRMMEHAVSLCRQKGCGLVQLTSNKARSDAHRFYGRLGFTPSHEGFKLTL